MVKVVVFNDSLYKRSPKKKISTLLKKVISKEGISNALINVIYVDDKKIKVINDNYLKHNYSTDVISFNLTEKKEIIGEIYISLETAEKQAKEYNVSLTNEIKRLAIHGALHIVGYDDNTKENRNKMTSLENKYLGMK